VTGLLIGSNVLEEKDREIAVLRRRIIDLEWQLYPTSEQNTSAQEGKLNYASMGTNTSARITLPMNSKNAIQLMVKSTLL
jgi:hypothetical protein